MDQRTDFDELDRYLSGEANAAEQARVDARAAADPELRAFLDKTRGAEHVWDTDRAWRRFSAQIQSQPPARRTWGEGVVHDDPPSKVCRDGMPDRCVPMPKLRIAKRARRLKVEDVVVDPRVGQPEVPQPAIGQAEHRQVPGRCFGSAAGTASTGGGPTDSRSTSGQAARWWRTGDGSSPGARRTCSAAHRPIS